MKIFVVNLDKATDRWEHYKNDERYERWSAWHWKDLRDDHPIFEEMISYWNIHPDEHNAKCGCFMTHLRLYKYLVANHLENVIIIEDDAELVGELPNIDDLPKDGFTYLGGFTSHPKMTKGPLKVELEDGVNRIKHTEYRVLTTMAIYIPHWSVAYKMIQAIESRPRKRAIDVMIRDTARNQYLYYPAPFKERPNISQIRKNKNKYCNEFYEWKK